MEKKVKHKEEAFLQHPVLFIAVLVLGFVLMDPFEIGPVGGIEFRPVKHDIAPYKEVMGGWPRDNESQLGNGKLEFVDEVFGPESLEFDSFGRGPYTGLADGRVVRWMGEGIGWETFAIVTSNWSEKVCARGVDSTTSKQWKHEKWCGRPLGLRFNKDSGDLYIADAYYGLLVVGPRGGLATPLATHVDGKPILFANDLDIHKNGSIFFTDTSRKYNRVRLLSRYHFYILLEGETTGRILRYDPPTKTTHAIPSHSFCPSKSIFDTSVRFGLMKYWLEGPRAGTKELVAHLPGFPDNVRMNENGQFWVAIDCCRTQAQEILVHNPWMRSLYFRLPIKMKILARIMGMKMFTMISLFDENGRIVKVLEDRKGVVMKLVSEVREVEGKLWIGTVAHNHIATLSYP
ncbi:Protein STRICTOSIDINE SYNTHASE-LIKE 13 [Hibiscus syriacus]|uniref:Protein STRICTOSIDINE SYNTHASE-LIKE 13 n=1 Tax=Hibiscus syriacus TaxID=106335 RepID=A0A6A2X5V1_HIBSY|nr:Protein STRICTOSIDINE SYNTHASE-LIKE 13 [Hibiscus syriacus]